MTPLTPLPITSGALTAHVLPRGATLTALKFAGQDRNLVLGFAEPADHWRVPIYAGHLVGPIANRLRGGEVTVNGTRYTLPRNENGQNCLHSGPAGLHTHDWTVAAHKKNSLTLTTRLADMSDGLPGVRAITATYALRGTNMRLTIEATTSAATPMNIAAHPYWTLGGELADHTLTVHAETYLPIDAAHLPTGEIAQVEGTAFDFRNGRPVPRDPALDLTFCLADHMRPAPQKAATLAGPDGTILTLATTAPGLQVYNGAHLPHDPAPMDGTAPLHPYSGIALEPQHWPDAPHHPGFPQIILQPQETYCQITDYHLTAPQSGTK